MNQYEFILGIIFIVMVTSIFKARYGYGHRRRSELNGGNTQNTIENERLRDEVKQLKERLHVLERIATDKESSLGRQIDELRDR
ncbi:MAG: hypothetical protein ABI422_07670 [Sphingomicrobium sp.]